MIAQHLMVNDHMVKISLTLDSTALDGNHCVVGNSLSHDSAALDSE
jgi:hypothetical protein